MDKDEIASEAQRIGTFPISIIPDQDCCTLFTPRHPDAWRMAQRYRGVRLRNWRRVARFSADSPLLVRGSPPNCT